MCFLLVLLSRNLNFQELGLVTGTPVASSLIDAHAGGVGVMESTPVSDSESEGYCSLFTFWHNLNL